MSPPDRLDAIDRVILTTLQHDARISNKELAGKAGLSPSACLRRVRALQENGALRGFHAEVDPEALGVGLQAVVSVRLRVHARADFASLRAYLSAQPEVVEVTSLAGEVDLLVRVAVRDVHHLREVTMDRLATREEVRTLDTALVFEHERSPLPCLRVPGVAAGSRGPLG